MVNSEEFIKRLEKILEFYGLSAAVFADTISVQRSSISHLLSGRNKPSLEFVLKVTSAFPEVNLYWLLNGKGTFPSKPEKQIAPPLQTSLSLPEVPIREPIKEKKETVKKVDKVIIFYSDGTFDVYDK
tara:strand:- start:59 stop:442 length:384 start_codon:yes stop_codon:yes gene_type:complete